MEWLKRALSGLFALVALVVSVLTLRRWRDGRRLPAKTEAEHKAEMERIRNEHEAKRTEIRERYDGERDAFDRMLPPDDH
jgi:heme A synthase